MTVTLEGPPYRACAARRMTPTGIDAGKRIKVAFTDFAAANRYRLEPLTKREATLPGISISTFSFAANGDDNRLAET